MGVGTAGGSWLHLPAWDTVTSWGTPVLAVGMLGDPAQQQDADPDAF